MVATGTECAAWEANASTTADLFVKSCNSLFTGFWAKSQNPATVDAQLQGVTKEQEYCRQWPGLVRRRPGY